MGNDASAAMMRSVGCVVEGVSRDSEYYHGHYVDTVMFGLTAEDFKNIAPTANNVIINIGYILGGFMAGRTRK